MRPNRVLDCVVLCVVASFVVTGAAAPGGSPGSGRGALPAPPEGWRPVPGPRGFAFYNPNYQIPAVSGKWNLWRIVLTDEQIQLVRNDPAKARQWESVLNDFDIRRASGIFLPEEDDYSPLDAAGLPAIRAKDHPAIGLYDASDPLLISTHLRWAQQIGLAGLIVDWDGPDTLSAKIFDQLENAAEKSHSPLFLAIRYTGISDGRKETAESDLYQYVNTHGTGLNVLRREHRPVVFIGRRPMEQLNGPEWTEVIASVNSRFPTTFFGDTDAGGPVSDAFDGYYTGDPLARAKDVNAIHDLYVNLTNQRDRDGTLACLTVSPGRDDSSVASSPVAVPRDRGALYKALFDDALSQQPDCILINSFNDWGSGTEIEPSVEYGRRYFDLTFQAMRPAAPAEQPP